jgi:hypothetical protein
MVPMLYRVLCREEAVLRLLKLRFIKLGVTLHRPGDLERR